MPRYRSSSAVRSRPSTLRNIFFIRSTCSAEMVIERILDIAATHLVKGGGSAAPSETHQALFPYRGPGFSRKLRWRSGIFKCGFPTPTKDRRQVNFLHDPNQTWQAPHTRQTRMPVNQGFTINLV